jgi:two-component system nitrate/nitrite response regulator NarL
MPMSDIATDTDLTPGVFEAPAPPQRLARRPARLSPRERQIVTFIAAGCSNQQIADCLGLKTQTIKNHLCRMYDKLGVSNRVHLAVFAVSHGMNSDSADQSSTG